MRLAKVKTQVKAGALSYNHNETLVRKPAKGLEGQDPGQGRGWKQLRTVVLWSKPQRDTGAG